MAEYRLSPAAEQDLEQIWVYTFQHWGLEQANRRRIVESHIIYFRITDYGIAIIRILHERMEALRHI